MRRREGRGENELRGAMEEMVCSRTAGREFGWKMVRSWRSVIRRVLVAGAGLESGGRLERSSDKLGRREEAEEEREERFSEHDG